MAKKENIALSDLFQMLDWLEETGVRYWLDGGWGVDALYGQQTRIHRDVDIDFDSRHTDRLLTFLQDKGFIVETDWLPTRAELYNEEFGYIDIHPFVLNGDGTSKQADLRGGWYEFPSDYFGEATLEGRTIPCISWKGQKAFHSGYELRDKDVQDLAVLDELADAR